MDLAGEPAANAETNVTHLPKNLVAGASLALALGLSEPVSVAAQQRGEQGSPTVQYRKSIMQSFRLHTGGVRAATSGTVPLGHAERHAVAFQQMTEALANVFPQGSAGEGSRALPAIWQNRDDFMNKITAIQTAAQQLVTASRSGDADAIGTALRAVQGTCGSCHDTYRGPSN